jgi:hypothetical protein
LERTDGWDGLGRHPHGSQITQDIGGDDLLTAFRKGRYVEIYKVAVVLPDVILDYANVF